MLTRRSVMSDRDAAGPSWVELPAIRPVNHVLADGEVIIRRHVDADLMTAIGQVVAYEADVIDPNDHVSWRAEGTRPRRAISRTWGARHRPHVAVGRAGRSPKTWLGAGAAQPCTVLRQRVTRSWCAARCGRAAAR